MTTLLHLPIVLAMLVWDGGQAVVGAVAGFLFGIYDAVIEVVESRRG